MNKMDAQTVFWPRAKAAAKVFGKTLLTGLVLGIPIGLMVFGLFSGVFAAFPAVDGWVMSKLGPMAGFVETPWPMMAFNSVVGGLSMAVGETYQFLKKTGVEPTLSTEHTVENMKLRTKEGRSQEVNIAQQYQVSASKDTSTPHPQVEYASDHQKLTIQSSRQIH